MKIRAMVVRSKGGSCSCEEVDLDQPRDDEVLVRIVATGICHTDISAIDQIYPFPLPIVLGHEGSGIVERVGAKVTSVRADDKVAMSFHSCGKCSNCAAGHSAYCDSFGLLNVMGARPDGSATMHQHGEPVHASFFSQSSFATHALCYERNVVRLPADAPLEICGPLGCGIQTGVGTVLNVLRPSPQSSVAVYGAGAVGLAAVMAAKIRGCKTIFAIDRVTSRLELAKELGATRVIDTRIESAESAFADNKVDYAIETTGNTELVMAGINSLNGTGTFVVLAGMKPGVSIPLELSFLNSGRRLIGAIEGDADPQTFIPMMLELHKAGKLPFDRLIRFYDFEDINQAIADLVSGVAIKPVLRLSA